MTAASEIVPDSAIDHAEVLRRGGANAGDEDFVVVACPKCRVIYLLDAEVDTIYLDAADLQRRIPVMIGLASFACVHCLATFPAAPWLGPNAPPGMRVTWADLEASSWLWVIASRPARTDR